MFLQISFGSKLDEKLISTVFSSSEVIVMPNDRVNGQFNQNTESKKSQKHSDDTAWKRRQGL